MTHPASSFTLPTWGLLRWLTDAGKGTPADIRARFIAGLFTSAMPLLAGGITNLAVNVAAAVLHPTPAFIALLAVDCTLLIVRTILLVISHQAVRHNRSTPTDIFVCSSLAWAGVVGVGTAMCLGSGDPVLQFLAPTTMMGILGGIATRNNGAPRLAVAQVILCDIPLQLAIPFVGYSCMWISIFQFPLFILAMISTIHKLNRGYVAVVLAERESEKRASHDFLTGLLNRSGLMATMTAELRLAAAQRSALALLYLDLDGFKDINDGSGHAAGDDLLCQVARRIAKTVPDTWPKGRLGGDEFVVLALGCNEIEAMAVGDDLIDAIRCEFTVEPGIKVAVGVSIGIACAMPDATVETLLAQADTALYKAKRAGKGRTVLSHAPRVENSNEPWLQVAGL